jgi:hypothetical protein
VNLNQAFRGWVQWCKILIAISEVLLTTTWSCKGIFGSVYGKEQGDVEYTTIGQRLLLLKEILK